MPDGCVLTSDLFVKCCAVESTDDSSKAGGQGHGRPLFLDPQSWGWGHKRLMLCVGISRGELVHYSASAVCFGPRPSRLIIRVAKWYRPKPSDFIALFFSQFSTSDVISCLKWVFKHTTANERTKPFYYTSLLIHCNISGGNHHNNLFYQTPARVGNLLEVWFYFIRKNWWWCVHPSTAGIGIIIDKIWS